MTELKPCPFCGQTPKMEESARFPRYGKDEGKRIKGYTVVCQNMYCILHNEDNWYRRSAKEASEEWNHRAEPEMRPLTLEEATESEAPVWLEAMGKVCIAQINLSPGESLAEYKTIGRGYAEYLYCGDYGILWRCWPRKPTPEQMAAAEWEE